MVVQKLILQDLLIYKAAHIFVLFCFGVIPSRDSMLRVTSGSVGGLYAGNQTQFGHM